MLFPRLGFGQPQNTAFGGGANNSGGGLFGSTNSGFGAGGKFDSRSSRCDPTRSTLLFLRISSKILVLGTQDVFRIWLTRAAT